MNVRGCTCQSRKLKIGKQGQKKWPTRLWGLKMLIDDSQIHKNGIGISKQGTFALKKFGKEEDLQEN